MTERTDRELLELAAKSAGLIIVDEDDDGTLYVIDRHDKKNGDEYGERWTPLGDDGDALRLAADLHISISYTCTAMVGDIYAQPPIMAQIFEPVSADIHAATRRAIVRAAAAMAEGGEQ